MKNNESTLNRIILLILGCFFLSGMTGLIYEILWTRMVVKIIGSAPFAVSIILTVFMGGLGLGSYIASRSIDNIKEPLRLLKIYGILEIVIGIYSLIIPLLLLAFHPLYAMIYNSLFEYFMLYNLLTFVGCAILFILPVTCMGATLPILCRLYVTRLSHLGTNAGRLYGLNTIGAALGALLCGFWLISAYGMWGALAVAVFINIVIGLACIVTALKTTLHSREYKPSETVVLKEREDVTSNAKVITGALIIFAISGFCSMALEVIWTRLLGLIVGPTTYSFTIVLVTFIFGLALGSILFGWLADKTGKPFWILILTQIAAAICALGISQILGNSQLFFAKLISDYQHQFTLLTITKGLILFGFMFIPTLCLGATFPLVGKIITQSVSKVGRSIGYAYAINTIGAVSGSFFAGFVLVPLLGKEDSLSFIVSLQLVTTLIIAGMVYLRKNEKPMRWALISIPAIIAIILTFYYPVWNHQLLAEGKYHRFNQMGVDIKGLSWWKSLIDGSDILKSNEKGELLYYGEGVGGFTTVLKFTDVLGNYEYSMANSGKVDASTRGDMKTQTLLAHFPMLFHPHAKKVMVLGLASGITAGEVLYYPVDQLDVIDINKQVVEGSDYFIPWNNNVLNDPRTNMIIQDGRAHLGLTDRKYDVIISEPSNPWMAGLATLFTEDFFSYAREALTHEGIFVQFMHSYQMDWQTFAMVGRTFYKVFPNSLLLQTSPTGSGNDYLLVGFRGSFYNIKNAIENIVYTNKSPNIKLSDPKLLYRHVVSEDLNKLFGGGPKNDDDYPHLEFAAPKLMHFGDPSIKKNLQMNNWFSDETSKALMEVYGNVDYQIEFAKYAASLYSSFVDLVEMEKATEKQKEEFLQLIDDYCLNNVMDLSIIKNDTLKQRCRQRQIEAIQSRIDTLPEKALAYFYLGELYSQEGKLTEAAENYKQSLSIRPNDFETKNQLCLTIASQGNLEEAVECFKEAVILNPYSAEVHYNLGLTYARLETLDKALFEFNTAIDFRPDYADAYCDKGVVLINQKKYEEAILTLTEAIRLQPEFPRARRMLNRAVSLKN